MENKVFLENLPKTKNGNINWKESVGSIVEFSYNGITGNILIKEYIKGNRNSLLISYLDNEYNIGLSEFKNCRLGIAIGKIKTDYLFNINNVISDEKRNITIIDKERRKDIKNKNVRFIKYHCNKCGYENWIREADLLKGKGCPRCCMPPRVVELGVNTIFDTDPWMIDLGISEEDAKKYTKSNGANITVKCPCCGRKKKMRIAEVYRYKSICCSCGDNVSYPEKFVNMLLKQVNVEYIIQLSKATEEWCVGVIYDFYFKYKNKKYIIETHGSQHPCTKYHNNKGFSSYSNKARTPQQELENDIHKEKLAKENGIDGYIVIDCSKSDMEFIKNEILNSKLAELYDLSNINWLECEKFALSNLAKLICDYWNQKEDYETTLDLARHFNLSRATICRYLKQGTKLKWCNYNGKEELEKARRKGVKNMIKSTSTKIEMFNLNGDSLGIFNSLSELEENSLEMFGLKLLHGKVSLVCSGKKPQYKGYTFKYV